MEDHAGRQAGIIVIINLGRQMDAQPREAAIDTHTTNTSCHFSQIRGQAKPRLQDCQCRQR